MVNLIAINWLFLVVDGAFPQLQIWLMGGNIEIPSSILKITLISSLVFWGLASGRKNMDWAILAMTFIFITWLVLHAALMIVLENVDIGYLIYGGQSYYFYILILPLLTMAKLRIRHNNFLIFILFVGFGLLILGLFQYFLNSPLLPTYSKDGHFAIHALLFNGKIRAFSLFGDSRAFGLFLLFLLAIIVAIPTKNLGIAKKAALWGAMIVIIIGIYATLKRGIYFAGLAMIVSWFFAPWLARSRVTRTLLPLVYLLLMGLFLLFVSLLFGDSGSESLASTTSLGARATTWESIKIFVTDAPIHTFLFGTGIVQSRSSLFEVSEAPLVDNIFMAVLLHGGIIGLILFLAVQWFVWRRISRGFAMRSPIHQGVALVWSTFPILALIEVSIAIYMLFAMVFWMVQTNETAESEGAHDRSPRLSEAPLGISEKRSV